MSQVGVAHSLKLLASVTISYRLVRADIYIDGFSEKFRVRVSCAQDDGEHTLFIISYYF